MHEDMLNLIDLLNLDADPDGVDARLDQDTLILVPRDDKGVEDDLWTPASLDLGHIVPFGGLRGEVAEGDGGGEGGANAFEVRAEGLGLESRETSALLAPRIESAPLRASRVGGSE